MQKHSPKAERQGYAPSPFFFAETNPDGDERLVAWTGDVLQLIALFESLLGIFPESLEILLKVERQEAAGDRWERYYGTTHRDRLIELCRSHATFVFEDGTHQLCVRDPESLEYVVIDHAGIVFIYSSASAFRACLREGGFEERTEALISAQPHWRTTPAGGEALFHEFMRDLNLAQVANDGGAPASS